MPNDIEQVPRLTDIKIQAKTFIRTRLPQDIECERKSMNSDENQHYKVVIEQAKG